ncbi:hypothetical protein T265_02158 [Opisthorchis viverrini]|uniref:Uncharacterized protein n=1 Tax=Opisthorchis viverrini TaxID=6198 RepID=A0A075A0A2_OPIVI|nr:hypothetical protein T265_02158 [Opisthorchis viverrini]KER31652.1 hypothetical protein T265_02158 [Opisthorchis viverrini]
MPQKPQKCRNNNRLTSSLKTTILARPILEENRIRSAVLLDSDGSFSPTTEWASEVICPNLLSGAKSEVANGYPPTSALQRRNFPQASFSLSL